MTRARAVPDVSIRAFLSSQDPPRLLWADRDGVEQAGVGAAVRLTASGADRFDELRGAATELFDGVDHEGPAETRPRLFGGFAFDPDEEPSPDADSDGRDAETADQRRRDETWDGFPSALFVLPRLQLSRADDRTWLSASAFGEAVTPEFVESRLDEAVERLESLPAAEAGPSAPGVVETAIHPERDVWIGQVERAIDRIATGELRKLVLATAMDVELASPIDVAAVLQRFRETYPDCYRFLVQPTEDAAFFGPPPERLLKLTDGQVRTEALAGSIARGDTPEDDAQRARSLRADDKRQHEQQLVVDAITEQLSRFGDVTEHEQTVRTLETIQHLRTPITATLSERVHVLELVEALHPTPAVGGLPRDAALTAIRSTEAFDRGWYAAPVGWIDADGDGEFTVAIRSGVTDGERATLFAGNGIVADSDPAAEWEEIKPKFRPILDELE